MPPRKGYVVGARKLARIGVTTLGRVAHDHEDQRQRLRERGERTLVPRHTASSLRALAPPSSGARPASDRISRSRRYGMPLKKSYIAFIAKHGMPCSVLL
jgi:hypothetical protein